MIEAYNNLACLQHGADPKNIQLHAQAQCKLCYYLKHKYGISTGFNTNTATQPWYRMGQGAGDACNQWVIGSDSLAMAYVQKANGWTIRSPPSWQTNYQTLESMYRQCELIHQKAQRHH